MQNVDPYKKESILKGLISPQALLAAIGTAVFWFTITSVETDNSAASSSKADRSAAAGPDLTNTVDIMDQADSMPPMRLARQGKMEGAIAAANILVKNRSHDALANLCAGDVFLAAGINDDGLRCLKKGIALSHRNKYASLHYAQKLAELGKNDDALAQYRYLVKNDPQWALPHMELAKLYLSSKMNAQAAEELKTVCELEERNYLAHKMRAVALARAQDLKGGLNEYVLATSQENQSGIPDILKPILGTQGNSAIARATYELQQQITARPDDYLPKLRLAQLYAYSGNSKEAKDLLMDARRQAPNNVEVHRTLAVVQKQLGEESPALSSFGLSVKLEESQEKTQSPQGPATQSQPPQAH